MTAPAPFKRLQAQSLNFEGLTVNCWVGGSGFPLLVLHGSGPGASSVGNWRLVLDDLAARYRVLAMDLVGFGGSSRKPTPPYFDFDLWLRQARFALGAMDVSKVGVIGHSISGALALRLAASTPAIGKVLTTGSMGTPMPVNPYLDKVWRCPANREEMRAAARVLIRDESLITDAYLDARMDIIGSQEYRAYFNTMFGDPFEQHIAAAVVSAEELHAIAADVLMLHGRDDLPFPVDQCSARLAPKIANADLWTLANCSHSVAMERPDAFVAAARLLLG